MKTRDAFAFRDFDGKRILQRPYFRQFGFSDASDAEILTALTATDSDELAELEEKNQRLNDIFYRLKNFHALIMRHNNERLTNYHRAFRKKLIDADAADTLSFQAKIGREQSLMTSYVLDYSMAVMDLMTTVQNLWQASEKALQAAYRRRFGERLKQARERAGLSRKELGDAINLTPNAYGLYETGKRDATTTYLIRLAHKLKVSADWLIGLE